MTKQNVTYNEPVRDEHGNTIYGPIETVNKSFENLLKAGKRGQKNMRKVDVTKPLDPPAAFLPEVSILLNILDLIEPLDYDTAARIINFVSQRVHTLTARPKTLL